MTSNQPLSIQKSELLVVKNHEPVITITPARPVRHHHQYLLEDGDGFE